MKFLELFIKQKEYDIGIKKANVKLLHEKLRTLNLKKREEEMTYAHLAQLLFTSSMEARSQSLQLQSLLQTIRQLDYKIAQLENELSKEQEELARLSGEKKALLLHKEKVFRKEYTKEIHKEAATAHEIYSRKFTGR